MTDGRWRPLGVESEEDIVAYDALHEGLPDWLRNEYWAWVRDSITVRRRYADGSGNVAMLAEGIAQAMCQTLRIPLPHMRATGASFDTGQRHLKTAMQSLGQHPEPLQIADFLLAHGGGGQPAALEQVLSRSGSAWTVGTRAGRPGLVRRVPEGVQTAADATMANAGQAGRRLAEAWEELYGLNPDASRAYSLAIKAVEDAAIPVVSPNNLRGTLGTVIADMVNQKDWRLPMDKEHPDAPTREVVLGMMRVLWNGQHDRHGGQPTKPGNVSNDEAAVAVGTAVTLVSWFDAGLPRRLPDPTP